jgi:hypothetical protein
MDGVHTVFEAQLDWSKFRRAPYTSSLHRTRAHRCMYERATRARHAHKRMHARTHARTPTEGPHVGPLASAIPVPRPSPPASRSLRVAEADIARVPALLAAVSPAQLDAMQRALAKVWHR